MLVCKTCGQVLNDKSPKNYMDTVGACYECQDALGSNVKLYCDTRDMMKRLPHKVIIINKPLKRR